MGRKKRKVTVEEVEDDVDEMMDDLEQQVVESSEGESVKHVPPPLTRSEEVKPMDSAYAMTSHSGELVEENIYVSDGSSDDEDAAEVVLSGSTLGLMRRGLSHLTLLQPNRQWTARSDQGDKSGDYAEETKDDQEIDDLSKLDPAQRAERLLREKQRKLEEAKLTARRLESEENAGRDPCLFSKRTAFDIRMDQIEDKPWTRAAGDLTDFFNYNMTEEDWLEYSQQQLLIRQELTDAARQRRPPDPTIVPVQARAPSKQTPKVAVNPKNGGDEDDDDEDDRLIGPTIVLSEENTGTEGSTEESGSNPPFIRDVSNDVAHVGIGGAWGAGAAPGSKLAQLIEEQERNNAYATDPQPQVAPEQRNADPSYLGESSGGSHHGAGGGAMANAVNNYYGSSAGGAPGYNNGDNIGSAGGGSGRFFENTHRGAHGGGVPYEVGRGHPPPQGVWRGRGRVGGRGRGRGGYEADIYGRKRGRDDFGGRFY